MGLNEEKGPSYESDPANIVDPSVRIEKPEVDPKKKLRAGLARTFLREHFRGREIGDSFTEAMGIRKALPVWKERVTGQLIHPDTTIPNYGYVHAIKDLSEVDLDYANSTDAIAWKNFIDKTSLKSPEYAKRAQQFLRLEKIADALDTLKQINNEFNSDGSDTADRIEQEFFPIK